MKRILNSKIILVLSSLLLPVAQSRLRFYTGCIFRYFCEESDLESCDPIGRQCPLCLNA
jgi:hypothetical protein